MSHGVRDFTRSCEPKIDPCRRFLDDDAGDRQRDIQLVSMTFGTFLDCTDRKANS